MRRLRFIGVVATAVFLVSVWPPTPAAAEIHAVATIDPSVSCSSGEVMVGGTFVLTRTWAGRKITVHTARSELVVSSTYDEETGVGTYTTTFDARLNMEQPATATLTDGWNGSFTMTAATCQQPLNATVTPVATSGCGSAAVNVMNPNPIMVAYKVDGRSLPSESMKIAARETTQVAFAGLTPGRSYRVSVRGDDGTLSSADFTVPLCPSGQPTTAPSSPTATLSPRPTPTPTATATPTPLASTSRPPLGMDPRALASIEGNPLTTDGTRAVSSTTDSNGWVAWVIAGVLCLCGILSLFGLRLLRSRNS